MTETHRCGLHGLHDIQQPIKKNDIKPRNNRRGLWRNLRWFFVFKRDPLGHEEEEETAWNSSQS